MPSKRSQHHDVGYNDMCMTADALPGTGIHVPK